MATRIDIKRLAAKGVSPAEIARRLGIAGSTVDHHLKGLGRPELAPPRRRPPGSAGAR